MLKLAVLFCLSFSTFAGENGYCSEWGKQDGVSCVFAGRSADLYARQCENPCIVRRYGNTELGSSCDREVVCHFNNPTNFEGDCSDWVKEDNVICYDPSTQSWEQRWVRACTVGKVESWCSRQKPF